MIREWYVYWERHPGVWAAVAPPRTGPKATCSSGVVAVPPGVADPVLYTLAVAPPVRPGCRRVLANVGHLEELRGRWGYAVIDVPDEVAGPLPHPKPADPHAPPFGPHAA